MAAFLDFVNGKKTYIVCAMTILYTWSAYFLGLMTDPTSVISSSQLVTMDFHSAATITLAALGAAFMRHGVQKAADAVGSDNSAT